MLQRLGWGVFFEAAWNESPRNGGVPGRVVSQHRGCQRVAGQFGEADAEVTGKFRHDAAKGGLWPAVGDWVVIDGDPGNRMRIHAVLPRRTEIARKMAGRSIEAQILAANVDFAFVMTGLDGDYNLRRLERYLALAWESGVRPIVILNKKDLCGECGSRVAEAKQVALGAPVFAISAVTGEGVDAILPELACGTTGILLGSSGTGKSTLTNRLLQAESQAVRAVRTDDSRGRHTTSSRQLFALENGALLIDTPGLRELQLWGASDGLAEAFSDIEELGRRCRFGNCSHRGEPGCAVMAAIADERLAGERLEGYRKLKREEEFLRRKIDPQIRQHEKRAIQKTSRAVRKLYRERDEKGKQ